MGTNADVELQYLKQVLGATGPSLEDAREQEYTPNEWAYFSALSGLVPAAAYSLSDHRLAYYRSQVDPDNLSLEDTARKFWEQAISGGGDVSAPTTPTGLVATAASSTTVDLSWAASTDNIGVTGYEYRYNGGAPVDAGAGTTETVSGLTASTLYNFEVRAYDAAGNRSGWSTPDDATTPSGSAATIALVSSGTDDASMSTYTFAGQALGAASADRLIAVCVGTRSNNDVDSVTVAGVSATALANTGINIQGQAAIFLAAVPAGTTGDIVIGATGGATRMLWAAFALKGVNATPVDTVVGADALTTVAGGIALSASTVYFAGGESECTWAPVSLVEQADLIADGIVNFSAAYAAATTAATPSVDAVWSNQTDNRFLAGVSFQPA